MIVRSWLRELARSHPEVQPFLQRTHRWFLGLGLFVFFVVGRIPVLRLRLSIYRSCFRMRIEPGGVIAWRAVAFQPKGISVGARSIVGNDAFLDGRHGISIAEDVNIAAHVHIYTMQHDVQDPAFRTEGGPVVLERLSTVGSRATILPGVVVGEGAVVAAGAVVASDVEPYTIVAGVPARKIGERTQHLEYVLGVNTPFQ